RAKSTLPKTAACHGSIRLAGRGRFAVRVILASRCRSIHILSELALAATSPVPNRVANSTHTDHPSPAASRKPAAMVITSRAIILGLVSSKLLGGRGLQVGEAIAVRRLTVGLIGWTSSRGQSVDSA